MLIRRVPAEAFRGIVARVSEDYGGNIVIADLREQGTGFTVKLAVRDAWAYGARVTWHGQHRKILSWEAFRDILLLTFERHPRAYVKTMIATYKGRTDFLAKYPRTGTRLYGSSLHPITLPELSVPREGDRRGARRELPYHPPMSIEAFWGQRRDEQPARRRQRDTPPVPEAGSGERDMFTVTSPEHPERSADVYRIVGSTRYRVDVRRYPEALARDWVERGVRPDREPPGPGRDSSRQEHGILDKIDDALEGYRSIPDAAYNGPVPPDLEER